MTDEQMHDGLPPGRRAWLQRRWLDPCFTLEKVRRWDRMTSSQQWHAFAGLPDMVSRSDNDFRAKWHRVVVHLPKSGFVVAKLPDEHLIRTLWWHRGEIALGIGPEDVSFAAFRISKRYGYSGELRPVKMEWRQREPVPLNQVPLSVKIL